MIKSIYITAMTNGDRESVDFTSLLDATLPWETTKHITQ